MLLIATHLLLWIIGKMASISFEPYSRMGLVRSSENSAKKCILLMPSEYLQRQNCELSPQGHTVYDWESNKIRFWYKNQSYTAKYFQTLNDKFIQAIEYLKFDADDTLVSQFKSVLLNFIPGNSFILIGKKILDNFATTIVFNREKIAERVIKLQLGEYLGIFFGKENSTIFYIYTGFSYDDTNKMNLLSFDYYDSRYGVFNSFSLYLGVGIYSLEHFTWSNQGGVEMKAFVAQTKDFRTQCFFEINLTDWNTMVLNRTQGMQWDIMQPKMCTNLKLIQPVEFFVDIMQIKYPYQMIGYLFSYKSPTNPSLYIVLKDLANNDHKFENCEEKVIQPPGIRNIFCKKQCNLLYYDYYTPVIDGVLIHLYNESDGSTSPHVTCFLFNDCYGCHLIETFKCIWRGDKCVENLGPKKSSQDCVNITNIAQTDSDVTIILRGVRLTNTFMVIELQDISTNESYKATSIMDYQVSFAVGKRKRMESNFSLMISNSDIKIDNLVWIFIDFMKFKNDTKSEIAPPLWILILATILPVVVMISLILLAITHFSRKNEDIFEDVTSESFEIKKAGVGLVASETSITSQTGPSYSTG